MKYFIMLTCLLYGCSNVQEGQIEELTLGCNTKLYVVTKKEAITEKEMVDKVFKKSFPGQSEEKLYNFAKLTKEKGIKVYYTETKEMD